MRLRADRHTNQSASGGREGIRPKTNCVSHTGRRRWNVCNSDACVRNALSRGHGAQKSRGRVLTTQEFLAKMEKKKIIHSRVRAADLNTVAWLAQRGGRVCNSYRGFTPGRHYEERKNIKVPSKKCATFLYSRPASQHSCETCVSHVFWYRFSRQRAVIKASWL